MHEWIFIDTLDIYQLCLSAGFLQTKNFVLIPIVKQNTSSWRRRRRAEWAKRVREWVSEGQKNEEEEWKRFTEHKNYPYPSLHSCFIQDFKKEEGSKRAWAAAIQSLSSHEKGRRWERYKCVFVLKSIHRDEHFPCIQFFFFFFLSIRFYFFIFPHSAFEEER